MEKDDLEKRAESSEFQLIEGDSRKYCGKYVAFAFPDSGKIVVWGILL